MTTHRGAHSGGGGGCVLDVLIPAALQLMKDAPPLVLLKRARCVCACVCVCSVCLCACAFVCAYVRAYMCVSVPVRACTCVFKYTCACVCACVFMYTCACVCTCVFMYTCACVCTCVFMYTCACVCTCVFMYACACVCTCMFMYARACVCTCVFMSACACVCRCVFMYTCACVCRCVFMYTCACACTCVFMYTCACVCRCVCRCVVLHATLLAGVQHPLVCFSPVIYVRLARTLYIRCIYGIFSRKITRYTVIYGIMYGSGQPYIYVGLARPEPYKCGVCTVFLAGIYHTYSHIRCASTVLATPTSTCSNSCVCVQDAPPCQCCPCTPNVIAKSLTYTFVPLMCLSSCV